MDGAHGVRNGRFRAELANDFLGRCPNAGRLVSNLRFNVSMENQLMAPIMQREKPSEVVRAYLKGHPDVVASWLAGVTTYDGKDVSKAVSAYFRS